MIKKGLGYIRALIMTFTRNGMSIPVFSELVAIIIDEIQKEKV